MEGGDILYPNSPNGMQPGYFDPQTGQFYAASQFAQPGWGGGNQMTMQNYNSQMQAQQPPYQPDPRQQPQQNTPQPPDFKGRVVERIEDVKPNEISMDGSFHYFPLKDGTKIYVKLWDSNAQLRTFSFIPEEPIIQAQQEAEKTQFEKILERLDDMEAKLFDTRPAPVSKKKEEK